MFVTISARIVRVILHRSGLAPSHGPPQTRRRYRNRRHGGRQMGYRMMGRVHAAADAALRERRARRRPGDGRVRRADPARRGVLARS